MAAVTGRIVVAQESRFRLVDDAGRPRLFVLAHDAPIGPQDLQELQRSQARVRVGYTEPGDLIALVAHELAGA